MIRYKGINILKRIHQCLFAKCPNVDEDSVKLKVHTQ